MIQNETSLRGFLGRILGWSAASAIENALRSVQLSVAHSATLVLLGDDDFVSCEIHSIAITETSPSRSPKPDDGDHRNRSSRSVVGPIRS